jgi:hypothetical protein
MSQLAGESPFQKRFLIPFWVIRILLLLIYIAIYALVVIALGAISNNSKNRLNELGAAGTVNAAIGIAVVMMVLCLICLILDIVCIVKRSRYSLTPRFFLIVNVIQTTFWVIVAILTFIGRPGTGAIIVMVIVLLSFLGLLVYATVIFHKDRKGTLRGAYAPAANPVGQEMPFIYSSAPVPVPTHPSYGRHSVGPLDQKPYDASTAYPPQAAYDPQTAYQPQTGYQAQTAYQPQTAHNAPQPYTQDHGNRYA